MKLVFAHDHKLRNIRGEYFTTGGLSDEILGDYLYSFDSVTVFCRCVHRQKSDSKLLRISDPRISIKPVSLDGSLIPSRSMLLEMESEIASSDALIVKLHSVIAEFAIRFARNHHVPYLIECVADPWDAYWNYNIVGKFVAPVLTWITKREIKRAPYVMYVTKQYLERKYPTKGKWIGCSDVNISDMSPRILNDRIKKIRDIGQVLKIGTLAQVDVKYKGQQYVIEALGILKKLGIRIDYELAGSGDPTYLHKVAESNHVANQVHFLGLLSHDEVFPWIDSLDLYVQPSKQEGLPRSLAEAISRGCPSLGSNAGGIGELISQECIFPKGDVKKLVQLVRQADKPFLLRQASRNFEHAKQYKQSILKSQRLNFYHEFAIFCGKK